MVPPGDFIPLAEETDLIIAIGDWVLSEACRINYQLHANNYPKLPIAINVSAKQFMQTDFIEKVRTALQKAQLEAKYLELEITETVAMNDIEWVVNVLQQLSDIGVSISIDDFGTGYSSLSYFRLLPINKLKIDRSFINRLTVDAKDNAIVTSIINMAHSLGLSVIAEGVERDEQYALLNSYKCNAMQGYLISRPVPYSELKNILSQHKK